MGQVTDVGAFVSTICLRMRSGRIGVNGSNYVQEIQIRDLLREPRSAQRIKTVVIVEWQGEGEKVLLFPL